MATSRYSYLRQYAPYVSPYNVDVIKDVMAYKQGRVDANRARMYEQIDYLMGQELAKPQDREYLRTRMSDTIARINEQFDGVDLSSDGVTRAIQGEISSVLDDKVINAIAGTREYQNLMRQIEDIRTNNPKLYSTINDQDAQMPYFNWLNDGKVGSRLGALHYTPYYDYTAEVTKNIKDFRNMNRDKKMQVPLYDASGKQTGAIMEIDQDMLSFTQARSFAAGQLSPQAQEQMRIEARYSARMNQMYHNPAAFAAYANQYLGIYDQEVAAIEAKIATLGDNEPMRNLYNAQLQEAKNLRASQRASVMGLISNYSPEAAANFVIQNNFLDNMANNWKYDNTSYTRNIDQFYFKKREDDRASTAAAEQTALNNLKAEQLRIQNAQDQIALEVMRKNPMLAIRGRRNSSNSDGSGGGGGENIFAEALPPAVDQGAATETRRLTTEVSNTLIGADRNYKVFTSQLYNALPVQQRASILADVRKNPELYGEVPVNDVEAESEAIFEWLDRNNGEMSDFLNGNNDAKNAFNNARSEKDNRSLAVQAINETRSIIQDGVRNLSKSVITDVVSRSLDPSVFGEGTRNQDGTLKDGVGLAAIVSTLIGSDDQWTNPYTGDVMSGMEKMVSTDSSLIIPLIEDIQRSLGEDFDISDYFNITESGINIKSGLPTENIPLTIQLIGLFSQNSSIRGALAKYSGVIGDAMNGVQENVNRELGKTSFSTAYKRFAWDNSMTGTLGSQFNFIKTLYKSKRSALGNPVEVNPNTGADNIGLMELGAAYVDGQLRRYLIANGDTNTMVEITNEELAYNGINPYTIDNKFATENYETEIKDIKFVDDGTRSGAMYKQKVESSIIEGGYGESHVCTKADVISDLTSIVNENASLFTEAGLAALKGDIVALVNTADYMGVKIRGVDNDGIKNIVVEFYDKSQKYDPDAQPVMTQFIPSVGDYADAYDFQFKNFAQKYWKSFLEEIIRNRIETIRSEVNVAQGQLSNGQVEANDRMNRMLNFLNEKRNAGSNNQ